MVNDIITTVVDVITGLLQGIGTGLVGYFQSIALEADGAGGYTDALNPFGVFIFVLLGIGAAMGLASLVLNLVRNRA